MAEKIIKYINYVLYLFKKIFLKGDRQLIVWRVGEPLAQLHYLFSTISVPDLYIGFITAKQE